MLTTSIINRQGPITLRDFVRFNPRTYHSSDNPLDADDWLRDIAHEMESAGVAQADRVTFAAYFLKGPAAQWSDSHKHTLAEGAVVNWQEFQTAFRGHHIPQGIMDRMKREFHELTQGKDTVDAYRRKFLDMSRYAPDDVSTDAKMQEKFHDGLHTDIQLPVSIHDFHDFATLVNKAIVYETNQNKQKEMLKRSRDVGSSSGSSSQKLKVWIPHNVFRQNNPAPRPSYVAPRPPPPPRRSNTMTQQPADNACFKCGKPGHFATECRSDQKHSLHCLQLAVATLNPATIIPDRLPTVVVKQTMWTWKKSRMNQLLLMGTLLC